MKAAVPIAAKGRYNNHRHGENEPGLPATSAFELNQCNAW
jgi:hypothetical protein